MLSTDMMAFPLGLSVEEEALARAEGEKAPCVEGARTGSPEVGEMAGEKRPKLECGWESVRGHTGFIGQGTGDLELC